MMRAISIHALREEGDLAELQNIMMRAISIHALREEGDPDIGGGIQDFTISIHALREEGDRTLRPVGAVCMRFLSTPSARRATQTQRLGNTDGADFYPRPPRGGRHNDVDKFIASFDFYPRPPRGGRLVNVLQCVV